MSDHGGGPDTGGRRRAAVRSLIFVFWLLTVAWLIRFEAFPEYFTRTLAGYKGLLSGDVMVQDNWMKILYKERPIGYSHTTIEVNEEQTVEHVSVINRLYVRLKAMGFEQPVFVDTEAYLDIMQRLQRFKFSLSSHDYKLEILARRAGESRFKGIMRTGNTRQSLEFTVPDDVILYSPMTEMAVKSLKPGETLTMRTFDPASLSAAAVTVRAERVEPVEFRGETVEAILLVTDYQGVETRSWMSGQGELIRQDTPFGWSMEACTADEALETVHAAGYSEDMIADMAVRCRGTIRNPEGTAGLRLLLTGAPIEAASLETGRQKVVSVSERGIELLMRPSSWPMGEGGGVLSDAERAAALKATPFVQADDPALRAQAARITGELTDDRDKAEAIYEWVHENVRKEISVSIPSALDVLNTLAGDCNEHTYLFTGLARAAGIPTRIMVGIAYNKGAFYYHAWPAVFLGAVG